MHKRKELTGRAHAPWHSGRASLRSQGPARARPPPHRAREGTEAGCASAAAPPRTRHEPQCELRGQLDAPPRPPAAAQGMAKASAEAGKPLGMSREQEKGHRGDRRCQDPGEDCGEDEEQG